MTYMDVAALSRTQLVPGKAIDVINRFFGSPWQARGHWPSLVLRLSHSARLA